MLVQFSVKNFRSFKDEATLSMVATAIKENEEDNAFLVSPRLLLLKSAVLSGANASGKSNLFLAMQFMKKLIRNSSKETQSKEKISVARFKLSTETEDAPARFEIIFIHEGIRYRYGFAVDEECVHAEWLFYVPKKVEVPVFTRKKQQFDLTSHFKSEEDLIKGKRIRSNALLLSVSAQFNGKIAKKIMEWFSQFNCISGLHSSRFEQITYSLMKNEDDRRAVLTFLNNADTGINDVKVHENKRGLEDLPPHMRALFKDKEGEKNFIEIDVKTYHKKYNKKKEVVSSVTFNMDDDESMGTQRFFELSGPLIDTLKHGKVLVVDELAAQLHPRLVKEICKLFNSKEKNPRNAQLIFSSHNTNILRKDLFRRDQVWFVEKDRYGASELYSLVEYKRPDGTKIRNDASYEKDYLRGRYGAVPVVRELGAPYGDG